MLRNYLKIALRNIIRHKGHTFINITGLAVGLATCILITLWVMDELSFDRFHQNANCIYRLCHQLTMGGTSRGAPTGSDPMAPAIQAACPEIAAITRINAGNRMEVAYGNRRFFEENILYADSQFFCVFTFPLIQGDPETALARAHTVVITRETARKYFGDDDPLGQTLRLGGSDDFTVTGVIDRIPSNSHLSFDFLLSFRSLYPDESDEGWRWGTLSTFSYLRTPPDTRVEDLENKISSVIDERFGNALAERDIFLKVHLQPLTEIHLHSDFEGEEIAHQQGDITYVLLFVAIAVGVLLIACANFINLTTAGSSNRMKEVGVRKTFGADRRMLMLQFLLESTLLATLALVVAVFLIELALPSFNTMVQRELDLEYVSHPWIVPGFLLFAVLVGVVAGFYPSISLSITKPIATLKAVHGPTTSRSTLRRVLVVGQYSISIALIIGTIMIYNQVNYMRNKKLGFAEDQVLVIRGIDRMPASTGTALKSEIAQISGVAEASQSVSVPGENAQMTNFRLERSDAEDRLMGVIYADESIQPTYGLELAAGRNFSSQMGSDSEEALLINEAAAREFGWEDPVGKVIYTRIYIEDSLVWQPRNVIGVVKDFHYTDLRERIEPLAVIRWRPRFTYLSVRVETADISRTLDAIKDRWNSLSGQAPFDYFFADQVFAEQYRAEQQLVKIAGSFSLLAIFVACLGLFGMASHVARQRTKEIGIRKVLGASTQGITALLISELVSWVLIANLIAWPIAYYVMDRWLQAFAYRTSINPVVFVISGTMSLVVAIATVGFQAVRAAHANPVDSLKYE
jgi:putative ABC transport system permease protein